jgi:hypothetical protein
MSPGQEKNQSNGFIKVRVTSTGDFQKQYTSTLKIFFIIMRCTEYFNNFVPINTKVNSQFELNQPEGSLYMIWKI